MFTSNYLQRWILFCTFIVVSHGSANAAELNELKSFEGSPLKLTVTENSDVLITGGLSGDTAITKVQSLNVSDGLGSADPYGGALILLRRDSTLKMSLQVGDVIGTEPNGGHCMALSEWSNAGGWTPSVARANLHTHGFLVQPNEKGTKSQPVYGDNIFVCTEPGQKPINYEIEMAFEEGDGRPAQEHPDGVNWIHPHVHGISKAQVSAGQAQMVVVLKYGDSQTEASGVPAKNLMLKDIQVVRLEEEGELIHYADQNPDFCGDYKTDFVNVGRCKLHIKPDNPLVVTKIDPDVPDAPRTTEALPVNSGWWIFSINGQEYPTITIPPGEDQVWRVQNGSANITHRLRLVPMDEPTGNVAANLPFGVLNMDGATPTSLKPGGSNVAAPQAEQLLLMPGSRAELYLTRPQGPADEDRIYQLVSGEFQAGFSEDSADTWPRIALARIVFKGQTMNTAEAVRALHEDASMTVGEKLASRARITLSEESSAAPIGTSRLSITQKALVNKQETLISKFANSEARSETGATQEDKASSAPKKYATAPAELCNDWAMVENFDPARTIRRIYFGIGQVPTAEKVSDQYGNTTLVEVDPTEQFVLSETFVDRVDFSERDRNGRLIGANNPVVLSTFDAHNSTCALLAGFDINDKQSAETWELVNVSAEVHNFHIHQMKFDIERLPDGRPNMRAPSPLDVVQLPASLALKNETVDLQHDTIIVPRGTDACADNLIALDENGAFARPAEFDPMKRHDFALTRPEGPGCRGDGMAGDQSGMLRVALSFSGRQFASYVPPGAPNHEPASFVFHCHILEHEDNGMMARIRIINPDIAKNN